MHRILEKRFEHREHWIEHMLEKRPEKIRNSDYTNITKVEKIPEGFEPVFSDTVMLNEHTQRKNIYRKKTTYLTVGGNHYKLVMTKEADELYKFRDDVFHIVLPVFIILVVAIFLANYLLSGYLFEPFRKILRQMSSYRIGRSGSMDHIKTSTYEFDKLKQLYENMRQRIENDYFQLKEYTENMSHELQTPLSIIQNKTESLLSANDLKPEQAKQLKVIYEETQQLSKLGRALNLITQIENKEFQDIKELKTANFIDSHLDKIQEMIEMKRLTVEKELDTEHRITIDPGLLDILLRNILKNAVRYAPEESVIRIETQNGEMRFINKGEATDFTREKIFDRFRKGRGQKSLGLGLSIVKKICEVSGLDIDYDYRDGYHSFIIREKHN
jgi:signal transduction histidine kinase